MNSPSPESEQLPVQRPADGTGPIYHRTYQVHIPLAWKECLKGMEQLKTDINQFSPHLIATFKKTKGKPDRLMDGDEFEVKMTVPLRAPVRVKNVTPHSFKLVTLENHIEAGEISFTLIRTGATCIFSIESYARSRDSIVDFFYDKVPLARVTQEMMWKSMCTKFSEACLRDLNQPPSEVRVTTQRRDEETGQWQTI